MPARFDDPMSPRTLQPAADPEAAIEELYPRFAPLLHTIAVKNFGILPSDAKLLVEGIFTTFVLQNRAIENPDRYLIGSICNASRQYLHGGDAPLTCGETPCAATPAPALLREVERKVRLQRLLGSICSRSRDILHRYYRKREIVTEIAAAVRCRPATVSLVIRRCLVRLASDSQDQRIPLRLFQ